MTTFTLESDDEEEVFPLLISPCSSSSTTATPPSSVSTPGSPSSSMNNNTTHKCLSPEAFSLSSSFSSSSSTSSFPSFNAEQKSPLNQEEQKQKSFLYHDNAGEKASRTTSQASPSRSQTSSRPYSSYYNSGEKVKRRTELEKDDVDHDQITPSSVKKKFGVYIHQTLLHPAAVSPFSLSLPPLCVQESPTEDLDASSSFCCVSSCRLFPEVFSCIPDEIRKLFQSSTSLFFAGLSFRGCLYEMLGISVVTFLVHLISSSLLQAKQEIAGNSLPSALSLGQETLSGTVSSSFSFFSQRFDFNGWDLAKRLPLLLYCLGAVFGLFCNPAFLYAGYTAFSLSSSSSPSSSSSSSLLLLSDASKMNWFSVNLLVMLQYLASGVSAFLASSFLSSSPSSLSLTRFSPSSGSSASIFSLPFWLAAASEALGSFLMAAAVLQFLRFSSLLSFSSSSSSSCSCCPSLPEQRSLCNKERQAEEKISAPPSYSSCWSSSLSSSSASVGRGISSSPDERRDRKDAQTSDRHQFSAFSASSPSSQSPFSKLAVMISGVLCLLLTCLFIPVSSSSFNPAIAYTSSCVEGQQTKKNTQSSLKRVSSPSPDFPSLRPAALSPTFPSSSSSFLEEAKKVEELKTNAPSLPGSFISSESAKEIREHGKNEEEGKDALVEDEYEREEDSFPDQHANLSAFSEDDTLDSGVHTPPQRGESSHRLRDGFSSSNMREQEREEEEEKKNGGSFLASFVIPLSLLQGDKKDGELESIHVLNREEGSSELLYEYDRAYDSATPCFTFFLLSSVSPYIGAVTAAWVWKRTEGVGLGGK